MSAVRPGQHGTPHFMGEAACPALVAENVQHGRRGAYENQARLHASAREIRVLAQEAITGMDGIAAGAERDTNDLGRVEIRSGTLTGQR
jgi:hypothetical protein